MNGRFSPQAKMLIKASFIGAFAEAMFVPVYAIFTDRIGGSILDAGVGFAIFSIATGIFVLSVGSTAWFHRHVRAMVFWGFVISALGDFGYILVRNTYQLFAVQVVVGAALGMLNPAWDSLYSTDGRKDDAATRWSLWTGGVALLTGVAALAGGLIVARLGFTTLFTLMAVLDLVAASCAAQVWFGRTEARSDGSPPWRSSVEERSVDAELVLSDSD